LLPLLVVGPAGLLLGASAGGCDSGSADTDELESTDCTGAAIDAQGRCRLPNGRFAKAICCAPPATACHADFVAAIAACVEDWKSDPDFDPYGPMEWDLYAACADAEPMSPVRDALCAANDEPFCALDTEAFALDYLPGCLRQATDAWLDATCVLGERYGDLFGRAEAMVIIGERTLTAASALTPLQEQQILSAIEATSYEPTTIAEAFEAVDEGIVNYTELWDASARRAFTAYEVGAGDNSFGKIFLHGTTTAAATIGDGDLYDCASNWGPERRRCQSDADCTSDTRCTGQSEASRLGRCIASGLDTNPAAGSACASDAADFGCPGGSGLLCAGAALSGEGLCLPAWQRGRFSSEPALAIPDAAEAGVESSLLVYGLATVDMDVRIDLHVAHSRPSDLRITLLNPAGTEALVFDGASAGSVPEIYLAGEALAGYSGDESVNGVWRLRAVDRVTGETGTIERFGLEVTSRWD
jgi:hypothetical protein